MSSFEDWVGPTVQSEDVVAPTAVERLRGFFPDLSQAQEASVPLGFHWCLCGPTDPLSVLGVDGHPEKGGFMPPVPLPRRMWAASEVKFLGPLRPFDRVTRSSAVARITEKTGQSGALVFVDVTHDTKVEDRSVIQEQQTIVYREAAKDPAPLPEVGSLDLSAWDHHETTRPDPVTLFRYSALTFNSHRIHYDLPYTKEEELYPALVVHGPLMSTLLLDFAGRLSGGREIRAYRFRAKSPGYADQPLHLVAKENANTLELRTLGADGRTVVEAEATF